MIIQNKLFQKIFTFLCFIGITSQAISNDIINDIDITGLPQGQRDYILFSYVGEPLGINVGYTKLSELPYQFTSLEDRGNAHLFFKGLDLPILGDSGEEWQVYVGYTQGNKTSMTLIDDIQLIVDENGIIQRVVYRLDSKHYGDTGNIEQSNYYNELLNKASKRYLTPDSIDTPIERAFSANLFYKPDGYHSTYNHALNWTVDTEFSTSFDNYRLLDKQVSISHSVSGSLTKLPENALMSDYGGFLYGESELIDENKLEWEMTMGNKPKRFESLDVRIFSPRYIELYNQTLCQKLEDKSNNDNLQAMLSKELAEVCIGITK